MNTKLLMAASALVMAVAGVAGLFAPHEILAAFGIAATGALPSLVQLLAALLLGFAMTNWMAKDSTIGGIYNRPLLVGNLMHFVTGAMTMIRLASAQRTPAILAWTVVYVLFAAGFGLLFFRGPAQPQR